MFLEVGWKRLGWSSKDLIIGEKFVALSLQNSDKILNSASGIDSRVELEVSRGRGRNKMPFFPICSSVGGGGEAGWERGPGGKVTRLSACSPHQPCLRPWTGYSGCWSASQSPPWGVGRPPSFQGSLSSAPCPWPQPACQVPPSLAYRGRAGCLEARWEVSWVSLKLV